MTAPSVARWVAGAGQAADVRFGLRGAPDETLTQGLLARILGQLQASDRDFQSVFCPIFVRTKLPA
jgi:hypothetical protein